MSIDITVRCERCGREMESDLQWVRNVNRFTSGSPGVSGVVLDVTPCAGCEEEAVAAAIVAAKE